MSRRDKLKQAVAARLAGIGLASQPGAKASGGAPKTRSGLAESAHLTKKSSFPSLYAVKEENDGDVICETRLFLQKCAPRTGANSVWFIMAKVFFAIQSYLRFMEVQMLPTSADRFCPRSDDTPLILMEWFQQWVGILRSSHLHTQAIGQRARIAQKQACLLGLSDATSWLTTLHDWARSYWQEMDDFCESPLFVYHRMRDYETRYALHRHLLTWLQEMQGVFKLFNTVEHSPVELPAHLRTRDVGIRTMMAVVTQQLTKDNLVERNFPGIEYHYPNLVLCVSYSDESVVSHSTVNSVKARDVFIPIFSYGDNRILSLPLPFLVDPKEVVAATIAFAGISGRNKLKKPSL